MRAYFQALRDADADPALRARGGADEIPKLFPRERLVRARERLEPALKQTATEAQRFQVRRSVDAMDFMLAYDDLLLAKAAFDSAMDAPTAEATKTAHGKVAAINARIRRYDPARYWSTAPMLEPMLEGARLVLGETKIDPWTGDFRGDSFGQKVLSFARMVQADGLNWSNSVDNGYIYGNGNMAAWYIRHDKPILRCSVDALTYDNAEGAGWLEWRVSFDRAATWEAVERVDLNRWQSRRLDLTKWVAERDDFVLGVFFAPGSNTRARLSGLSLAVD